MDDSPHYPPPFQPSPYVDRTLTVNGLCKDQFMPVDNFATYRPLVEAPSAARSAA